MVAMICFALAVATPQMPMLLGPDTDILVVSNGCPPCEIVKRAVRFQQDTLVVNKDDPNDSRIIRQFHAQGVPTPTLIVREEGRVIRTLTGADQIMRYWR